MMIMIIMAAAALTMEQALIGAVVALAGAVVVLWGWVRAEVAECKRDRKELWKFIMETQPKTCGAVRCPDRMPLELPGTLPKPKPA